LDLSDDDPIASGAVADLLQLVRHCHADFIHTSSPLCQHDAQIIVGDVSQLLKQASLASCFGFLRWFTGSPLFVPLLALCGKHFDLGTAVGCVAGSA